MQRAIGAYRPFASNQPYSHYHSAGVRETAPIYHLFCRDPWPFSEGDLIYPVRFYPQRPP